MKLRIVTMFISVATVSAWGVACNVQQAKPECLVGRGAFAAKYTLKPGQTVTGACAQKTGEVLGVQKYADPPPNAFTSARVAIKPNTLVPLAPGPSAGVPQTSIITLAHLKSTDPDADNWCPTDDFPALSFTDPGSGTTYGYTFKNVKFFDTAAIPGTQFQADLDYTEGGCTASYSVQAVFPAVSCSTDADCLPNPANFGASLNPQFPVHCDTTVDDGSGNGLCILTKPVPACVPPSDNPQACSGVPQ